MILRSKYLRRDYRFASDTASKKINCAKTQRNGAWKITSPSKNDSAKRGFNMNISPHPDPDAELLFIPWVYKGYYPFGTAV